MSLPFTITTSNARAGKPEPWLCFPDGSKRVTNAEEQAILAELDAARNQTADAAKAHQADAAAREKELAELREENGRLKAELAAERRKTSGPRVAVAIRWQNGQVECLDDLGEPIPDLAGDFSAVRYKVLAACGEKTVFHYRDRLTGAVEVVEREMW